MITTYDLGDPVVQRALVDELCALGFDAEVCAGHGAEARLTVTHAIEDGGRLDGLVYAAVPTADIATTDLDGDPRQAVAQLAPPDEDAPSHVEDIA